MAPCRTTVSPCRQGAMFTAAMRLAHHPYRSSPIWIRETSHGKLPHMDTGNKPREAPPYGYGKQATGSSPIWIRETSHGKLPHMDTGNKPREAPPYGYGKQATGSSPIWIRETSHGKLPHMDTGNKPVRASLPVHEDQKQAGA